MATLMSQQLPCPRCGSPRVLLKTIQHGVYKSGKRVIDTRYIQLVLRCPIHGAASVTIPFQVWGDVAGRAGQHLLMCKKCGKPCTPAQFKMRPEVSVITVTCPLHGIDQRLVSTSLASTLWQQISQPPLPAAAPPPPLAAPGGKGTFCPGCGAPVDPADQFCGLCGRRLA